jgi:hypothetical protein
MEMSDLCDVLGAAAASCRVVEDRVELGQLGAGGCGLRWGFSPIAEELKSAQLYHFRAS